MLKCQQLMLFLLLINVKMPTIVGILSFMTRRNSIISLSEPEKADFFLYFHTFKNLEFYIQLSLA